MRRNGATSVSISHRKLTAKESRAQVREVAAQITALRRPQPAPRRNDSTPIAELVLADVQARRELGRRRYGTDLQAHNGRDALRDAYEEVLDLAMYLRQEIEERATRRARTRPARRRRSR